jgi:hypothetical protein
MIQGKTTTKNNINSADLSLFHKVKKGNDENSILDENNMGTQID